MNHQLEPYQPLISRRITYTPKHLPPPPMVSRRMEFGLRTLKHRLHEKSVTQSIVSEMSLSLPFAHNQSQTPAPTSRFFIGPPPAQATANKRLGGNRCTKSPEPGRSGVRFEGDDSEEDDDSRNEIERDGEEGGEGRISKPQGEPGRPRSGGYTLEEVLGWNEATFEAVRVSHT